MDGKAISPGRHTKPRVDEENSRSRPDQSATETPEESHAPDGRSNPKEEPGAADLVESLRDPLFLVAPDGTIRSWSTAGEKIFGLSSADAIGAHFALLMRHEAEPGAASRVALQLSADDGEWLDESWWRRGDGSQFWARVRVTALRNPAGELTGFACLVRDQTRRRRADERFREVAEKANCLLWIADVHESEDGLLHWNIRILDEEIAQRFLPLEFPPDSSYARAWYLSRMEEDRLRTDAYSAGCLRAGRGYRQEFRCLNRHRQVQWLDEDVVVDSAGPGRWRLTGVCRDITAQKEAEVALLAETERRRRQTRGLTALASGSSVRNSDPDRLARQVARLMAEIPGTVFTLVCWLNPVSGELNLFGSEQSETMTALSAESASRLIERLRNEQVLVLPVDDDVLRLLPGEGPWCNAAALVMAPIRRSGKIAGLELAGLAAGDTEPADADLLFIQSLAELMGTSLESADRARAEEALQRRTEHLNVLIDAVPGCVKLVSAEGLLLDMNRNGLEMIDAQDLRSLQGKPVFDLVAPEHQERFRAFHRNVCAGERGVLQFEMVTLRGRRRWIESHATPLRLEDEEQPGMLSITHDITLRRLSEEALRTSQERMRLALRAAGVGIWESDACGELTQWSVNVIPSLGDPEAQAASQRDRFLSLVHPEDRPALEAALTAAGKSGREFNLEYRIRHPGGSWRWIATAGALLPGLEGESGRIVGLDVDITPRKQAEAELHQAREQLLQAQKLEAIGRLAGGVAHDFNNLLAVINGYSELCLDRHELDSSLRKALQEINKAGERAAALTSQLLAFSRRSVLQPERVDVREVILGMTEMLAGLLGPEIELDTSGCLDAGAVWIDRKQLEQTLVTLAVNGRGAMPAGGALRIACGPARRPPDHLRRRAAATSNWVELTVEDTGAGIEPGALERIWEPFFTPGGEPGAGLGLAAVYGVVHQAGGEIEVESTPGSGARFRVFLPVVQDEPSLEG